MNKWKKLFTMNAYWTLWEFQENLWKAQILKLAFFQFSFLVHVLLLCFSVKWNIFVSHNWCVLLPIWTSLFGAVLTYFELNLNPTCPFAHSDDHLGPSKYIVIYLFTFILLSCYLLEATIANWEGVEKVAENKNILKFWPSIAKNPNYLSLRSVSTLTKGIVFFFPKKWIFWNYMYFPSSWQFQNLYFSSSKCGDFKNLFFFPPGNVTI
jgi:hypothetical protein